MLQSSQGLERGGLEFPSSLSQFEERKLRHLFDAGCPWGRAGGVTGQGNCLLVSIIPRANNQRVRVVAGW